MINLLLILSNSGLNALVSDIGDYMNSVEFENSTLQGNNMHHAFRKNIVDVLISDGLCSVHEDVGLGGLISK